MHRGNMIRGELDSFYEQALDHVAMVLVTDKQGRIVKVNQNFSQRSGFTSEELIGKSPAVLRSGLHDHFFFGRLWKTILAGDTWSGEMQNISKNGKAFWVQASITPVFNSQKEITHFLSIQFDITFRKNAEEDLRESSNFVEKITQTIPGAMYIYNLADRRNIFSNQRIETLVGYSPQELKALGGNLIEKVLYPDDRPIIQQAMARVHLRQDGEIQEYKYRVITKDGRIVWLQDRSQIFRRDEQGKPLEMIGIIEDITEKVTTEAQIENERMRSLYAAKMVSLGEMAGGIAHEINNPVALIVARAEHLQKVLARGDFPKEKIIDSLAKIETTAYRISKIVKGLKTISRNGDSDPFVPANLSQLLDEVLTLCKERFSNAEIDLRVLRRVDIDVDCRAVQIAQVLLNILNNSFDAVSSLSEKWVEIDMQCLGEKAEISFKDSGKGIPPKIADRLAEPFFTTKEPGKGTGLGLSISNSIVKEHGGNLFYDKNCENTRFVLCLPKGQSSESEA